MNKKVLTISTGMLLSTALAFSAIQPNELKVVSATDFKSGNNYYVVADVTGNGLSSDDILLSITNNSGTLDGQKTATLANASFDTKGILFQITEAVDQSKGGDYYLYSLYSNDAEAYVAFDGTTVVTDPAKTKAPGVNLWSFNDGTASNNIKKYDGTAHKLNNNNASKNNLSIVVSPTAGYVADAAGTAYPILFCVANRAITDADLNKFFNQKGFNLAVNYDSENYTLDENIFGGDRRIWAYEVKEGTDFTTGDAGYKVTTKEDNGKDLIIPAGMYFFTERVLKSGVDVPTKAADIDWEASTLIMVSPKQTVETTKADRSKGQGFKLVALKGSEFIFQDNTSKYKVGDNAIWNACFTVNSNVVSDYPYSISLEKFYYQNDANLTDDKEAAEATGDTKVSLGLLGFDADKKVYLTTVPGAAQSIFAFSDSAVKDAKELLKTTKEAAVYAIKFVAGTSEDQPLVGKYLSVALNESQTTTNAFQWVAKGSAIANTTYPLFQYTITSVRDENPNDDVEKYTLVTFTNRETNQSFEAKLFPEPSYGENCYSMALSQVNGTVATTFEIQPLKVVSNTYKVETDGGKLDMDENIIIKLEPVTVDEYAGFYNVDNESIRTIRFARDKNDTSDCWYAGAAAESNTTPTQYTLRPDGTNALFVEDVYAAAQFQLVKAPKATTIDRVFVWNNTATKDVDDALGDKVSAYKYALRYVNDGSETNDYLTGGASASDNDLDLKHISGNTQPNYYYIKINADGSVSLFDDDETYVFKNGSNGGVYVADPAQSSVVTTSINSSNTGLVYNDTYTNPVRMYAATSAANSLKTYLDAEAPSLSWEGEGHVTLQNATGMAGDYITVNDDNEGILVNDAAETFYLHETDKNAIVPSFYISLGKGEGSNALSERNFLFNPVDSVSYPVNMTYDPDYQLSKSDTKAIFKAGTLDASRDTMTVEGLKGEKKVIASEADNESVWGGLDRFKFQIIENAELEGLYNIRQVKGSINEDAVGDPVPGTETVYLASSGQKLYFTTEKAYALDLAIKGVEAPTANESVSATEVKVVAYDGSINIKNAAGKNVVVSTILGQIVANEVLTSDNATISVPAGIAIVSVDGEEAVKVSVR